ncbi:MAG: Rrf2 family transcriptional regulator [Gemmatimonadetes bacterium]|nr:Rrf2 family transcriptional regulator [Gemmatimonadota bacterium]
MRVTTWAEYGLIVALHLARRREGGTLPARDVAENEGLPTDYVEQILLKLRRAGLVTSTRGAHGGYLLARAPADITVKDVVEAAEHHTFEVNCDVRPIDPVRCSLGTSCSIRPVWRALQHRIDDLLNSVSLAELLREEVDVEQLVMLR